VPLSPRYLKELRVYLDFNIRPTFWLFLGKRPGQRRYARTPRFAKADQSHVEPASRRMSSASRDANILTATVYSKRECDVADESVRLLGHKSFYIRTKIISALSPRALHQHSLSPRTGYPQATADLTNHRGERSAQNRHKAPSPRRNPSSWCWQDRQSLRCPRTVQSVLAKLSVCRTFT